MRLLAPLLLAAAFAASAAPTDERGLPLADVLSVDATVSEDVSPDLAVVTLAIVREGPEVAPLTRDVNAALAKTFADAKAVAGVVAASGGYSTFPRYDSRGGNDTRTGWQVRAEVIVKSRDFNALGNLVGRLSETMQIAGSSFEISPELRAQTSSALVERGVRAFQEKATLAARAFGFANWSIRQVTIGSTGQSGIVRPMMREATGMSMSASTSPLPVEAGRVTLTLGVSGSVQMRR